MDKFWDLLLASLISNSVAAAALTLIFKKRTEKITAQVKDQFERSLMSFKSGYQLKEQTVSELLGQLCLQFNRTKRAFKRYSDTNLYLEAKVLKDANEKIRDLLLAKSYLIPPELIEDADELIEHYDVWLEEFYKQRDTETPNLNQKFIFAGPKGYRFPTKSEDRFKEKYFEFREDLYGQKLPQTSVQLSAAVPA